MTDFTPQVSIQDEVLSFLVSAPTPQAIIDFRVSEAAQLRLRYLLDVNREGIISDAERIELEESSQINHVMLRLKVKARQVLRGA